MATADLWGCDLHGWGPISAALGVHPRTARRWAAEYDGCPLVRVAGRPRVASGDLRQWAERCGLVVRPASPPNAPERPRRSR